MRKIVPALLLSIIATGALSCSNGNTKGNKTSHIGMSEETTNQYIENGIDKGVSGAFTGMIGSRLIMAGGCNFPENPLAPDSKKKFYKGIYLLGNLDSDSIALKKIGSLPHEIAYGAAVPTNNGLVLIGGTDGNMVFADTYLLQVDSDARTTLTRLPELPFTADNTAATAIDNVVYIAGGNVNGVPSNSFYSLDLSDTGKGWEKLPDFPGNPRTQLVMSSGIGAHGAKNIYLWGGFAPKTGEKEATLNTDGLKYDITRKEWSPLPAPLSPDGQEISLGGGAAAITPHGMTVAVGGVNKDIFLAALRNQPPDYLTHPPHWYKFNGCILLFNPATESWSIMAQTQETARAGAGIAVTPDNELIVVGGEIKPRIRTPHIGRLEL